jgi:hypothetical protein
MFTACVLTTKIIVWQVEIKDEYNCTEKSHGRKHPSTFLNINLPLFRRKLKL